METYTNTLFGLSIKRVYDSWTALQLAVSHGFGGAESRAKADWLVFATETWINENENIESYELEDFLSEVLNNEFDLVIDDASLPEVASKICLYHRLFQEGRESDLQQQIEKLPKPAIDECIKADNIEDEDLPQANGSEEKMSVTEETSQSENGFEMEDDGWQVVKRGKKR